jgi:hypothetical protein
VWPRQTRARLRCRRPVSKEGRHTEAWSRDFVPREDQIISKPEARNQLGISQESVRNQSGISQESVRNQSGISQESIRPVSKEGCHTEAWSHDLVPQEDHIIFKPGDPRQRTGGSQSGISQE